MARIRTIKPEFPQSESMGRVSRDARLLFVMLWTISDDAGRARANSRMLASLLFPYDDDAARLIPEWLMELEREGSVRVYAIDGNSYLQIEKWDTHQKIDHPSPSRLPPMPSKPKPRERSRKPRETVASRPEEFGRYLVPSTLDQDRTMDQDLGRDSSAPQADAPSEALTVFNLAAKNTNWPQAQRLTEARRALLKARLVECGGLDGWREALDKAQASDFLAGRTPRGDGHEKWQPGIDFFLKQSVFTKLMEGAYDNHTTAGKRESPYEQTERIANKIIRDGGYATADSSPDSGPGIALRAPADERSGARIVALDVVRRPESENGSGVGGRLPTLSAKRSE